MNAELRRRSHEVFTRALDVAEPERRGFIESACGGDPALRDAVERLVRAIEDSATFLDAPAMANVRQPAPSLSRRTRIGSYRIIRTIGIGGMATVYEAESDAPRRRVALKVMRHGLSRTSAVSRFRFETEVLARLTHPGIARIYEAGAADDGDGVHTPFFAMELVEQALPITAFAETNGLDRRDRLTLFASVCDAVHHGHQFGVIHRDLKPGNILVGADGRAKVIDFGVARSADPAHTRLTLESDLGHLIGTLNSMSPEQCLGEAASLDIRTDVYSLGVVLYELMCGRPPHDLARAPLTEALRIVQHEQPPRPSTVEAAIRGDLEAVMLKALEKERERRYASASEFAADIRRHLRDEPVVARPPTTLYLLRSFARRHRPVVAAAVAIAATLVAGISATSWMAYQANIAREAAEDRQRDLERVAAFQDAQLSGIDVRQMGADLRASLEARDPATVDFTDVARASLDRTLMDPTIEAIESEFRDQPQVASLLYSSVARTAGSLGLLERSADAQREALRIRRATLGDSHPDTIESLHGLGAALARLSRHEEAERCFREALEVRTRLLGPEDAHTLATAYQLGNLLQDMGRFEEAEPVVRSVLETRSRVLGASHPDTIRAQHSLANLLRGRSGIEEAEGVYRAALAAARASLGDGDPETHKIQTNLSSLLAVRGEFAEAESLQRELIEIRCRTLGNDHPDTLLSISTLASNLQAQERFEEAQTVLFDLLERRERVLGPMHAGTLHTVNGLAGALRQSGRVEASVEFYERALEGRRRTLGDDHPDTLQSIHNMSGLMFTLGRHPEAESLAREAIERGTRSLPEGHWYIGVFRAHLGDVLVAQGRFAEASVELIEAHRVFERTFGASHHRTIGAGRSLAVFYEAWTEAEPSEEHRAEAARWREAYPGAGLD